MILHEYTSQINRSKYPQQTARKIANDLNKKDCFNNYLVSFELGSKRYIIEKFEIKGMNR
mgnify:FL=1